MKRIMNRLPLIGAMLVGLLLAGASLYAVTRPKTDWLSTEGIITEIRTVASGTEDVTHTVLVDYAVGGTEYHDAEYGAYASSMEVGGAVEVLYDPADPTRIRAPGAEIVPYVVGGAGIVTVLVCAVLFLRRLSA